jgi:hypothetical protein
VTVTAFSPTAGNFHRCERFNALGLTADAPEVIRGTEIGSSALRGGDHTNAPADVRYWG